MDFEGSSGFVEDVLTDWVVVDQLLQEQESRQESSQMVFHTGTHTTKYMQKSVRKAERQEDSNFTEAEDRFGAREGCREPLHSDSPQALRPGYSPHVCEL